MLALADLEAAASVLAAARDASGDPPRQAAILVHDLVRRQIFGPRTAEVAPLAACQLLALHGLKAVDVGAPAAVRYLLAGVAGGRVGVDELAAWLEQSTTGWREQMFERFADRARQAVVLAQEEARRLGHPEVGTEHILLGLVREGESGAAQVLAGRGADLDAVRQEVARQLAAGGGDRAAAKPSKEAMVADIEALYGELDWLSGEVAHLRGLLRHHGIEPDQGTTRSA